ncbi:MurR/RpiR family transcriptional regulator [Bradyrhizobium sp. ISRA463]|uniref:MurR/RpiR family transcriptional regulator n=1 Tax=Bradyrhizobium sp. ISRA463 TaxID=2866199 RepID=UPI002478B7E6|nr:MurR/RpiR family transcriptional regulator [Bradyrhizobium sp. ISRA463]WGS19271.1 MurR/RpiR family transcriptional regulator [Bradyrhizobium sp. ISRA463]
MTTVRETIRRESANLTLSERKIGDAVLADYPFGALQTIQELAERTGVSAPSITRFVGKLGFAGYQEFQRQLITEVRESRRSPLQLKATEKLGSAGSFLADYARRATERIHEMSASVPQEQFDRVLTLLADPNRAVFLVGGRISDNIAGFLSVHLKQIDRRYIIFRPTRSTGRTCCYRSASKMFWCCSTFAAISATSSISPRSSQSSVDPRLC